MAFSKEVFECSKKEKHLVLSPYCVAEITQIRTPQAENMEKVAYRESEMGTGGRSSPLFPQLRIISDNCLCDTLSFPAMERIKGVLTL